MTKLEVAKNKLERIRSEQAGVQTTIRREHDLIPFGQPNIIGRPDIYKNVKRQYDKQRKLYEEEKKQENRVDMLEKVEDFKEDNQLLKDVHVIGKSAYATVGAKTSVNNIDYFKEKLAALEATNEQAKAHNKTKPDRKAKTYGTEITKLKRKIASLEEMKVKNDNQVLCDQTKELIESEKVKQWMKKPIYYFVTGLRKVAFEVDNEGNFYVSSRYPAYTEEDKSFINELLNN